LLAYYGEEIVQRFLFSREATLRWKDHASAAVCCRPFVMQEWLSIPFKDYTSHQVALEVIFSHKSATDHAKNR